MKIEDLKNTKIYLSNEEDRRKFQEKVFKLGVKWGGVDCIVRYLVYCFYYIDRHLVLSTDSFEDISYFNEDESKQIFLHDVLSIEEPEVEHKFNPYDKVLVRDHKSQRWCPTLYSYYDSEFAFPHVTAAGIIYKYCIPYEGNEHLVGTTNSPD